MGIKAIWTDSREEIEKFLGEKLPIDIKSERLINASIFTNAVKESCIKTICYTRHGSDILQSKNSYNWNCGKQRPDNYCF